MSTFADIQLIEPIHSALESLNYEVPTPIQAATIPSAIVGCDILGCAQTGTGKTAAFAIPILHTLGKNPRKARPWRPYALVLAPTRELAIQIGQSLSDYGRNLKLRHTIIYGGVHQGRQVQALERGVHILVATPGRLLDLMNQEFIDLGLLEIFVLDEADRMLDMGFMPDLQRIMAALPEERQSLFFSATMPPRIEELAGQLLTNPVSVDVTPAVRTVEKISQKVIYMDRFDRSATLLDILSRPEVSQAIVFTKTKHGADAVADKLVRSDIAAAAIHGDKSQNNRQRTLLAMRQGKLQVLVATDVAARGIDIDGISHVINFDLPLEVENYTHRIGRTGRAGAEGVSISFCIAEQKSLWLDIQRFLGKDVTIEVENRLGADFLKEKSSGGKGKGKGKKKKGSRQSSRDFAPQRETGESSRPARTSRESFNDARPAKDARPAADARPRKFKEKPARKQSADLSGSDSRAEGTTRSENQPRSRKAANPYGEATGRKDTSSRTEGQELPKARAKKAVRGPFTGSSGSSKKKAFGSYNAEGKPNGSAKKPFGMKKRKKTNASRNPAGAGAHSR